MSRLLLISCSALLFSACFSPTLETPLEESATTTDEVRSCRAGSVCTVDADCCRSHYCDVSSYAGARCAAVREKGAYCSTDNQCRSKACENFSCVAHACTPQGSVCSTSGDCCTGTFCDTSTYGPTKCRAARPDGAYCDDARQCQAKVCTASKCGAAPKVNGAACTAGAQCVSGSCQKGHCAAVCAAAGASCTANADCCGGAFCNNLTYAPWTCTAPQANGAYCDGDAQCQSGNCHSSICAAAVCGHAGTACLSNGDCCGGTFCFNYTYAPPVCHVGLANGTSCFDDAHCQSGHCNGSVCAAAACTVNGQVCQSDSECCAGGFCDASFFSYSPVPNVCKPAGATGAYCESNRQCASGRCVNAACAL